MIPPYFKQEHNFTCSLAVLRMVLAQHGVQISEQELLLHVSASYGNRFKNLWNPTIAKLACEYGIDTTMYADWPLFRADLLVQAREEYRHCPDTMDVRKYEKPNDRDKLPEPLPLAYKEVFAAINLGCKTVYGGLTADLLEDLLQKKQLVQTSVRTELLYQDNRVNTYHSILIYGITHNKVDYHDPAREPSMNCDIDQLIAAGNGTGSCMAYNLSSSSADSK